MTGARPSGGRNAAAGANQPSGHDFQDALATASEDQDVAEGDSPVPGNQKKDTQKKPAIASPGHAAAAVLANAPAIPGGSFLSWNLSLDSGVPEDDPSAPQDGGSEAQSQVSPLAQAAVGIAVPPTLPAVPQAPDPQVSGPQPQEMPAMPDVTAAVAPVPVAPDAVPEALPKPAEANVTPNTPDASDAPLPQAPDAPAAPASEAPPAPETNNQTLRLSVPAHLRVEWQAKSAAPKNDRNLSFGLRLKQQDTAGAGAETTPVRTAPLPAAAPVQPATMRTAGLEIKPAAVAAPAAHADKPVKDVPLPESTHPRSGASDASSSGADLQPQPASAPAQADDRRRDPGTSQGNKNATTSQPVATVRSNTRDENDSDATAPTASQAPVEVPNTPVTVHTAPKPEAPAQTVEAPKAAEAPSAPAPVAEVKDPAPVRPAQEIAISVSSAADQQQKVEVRLVDRAGEVHVSVRTPDETLAHAMREDLGSLTGRLAQNGFSTESYTQVRAETSSFSDQRGSPENAQHQGSHRQGQGQGGGASQQQQQQDERGRRPAWLEAMENFLNQPERSTTWPLNR